MTTFVHCVDTHADHARTRLHEVGGDSVRATGDGFEFHSLQVHVFGQTPLQHVSYHTQTQRDNKKKNTHTRESRQTPIQEQTVNIQFYRIILFHEGTLTQPYWILRNS